MKRLIPMLLLVSLLLGCAPQAPSSTAAISSIPVTTVPYSSESTVPQTTITTVPPFTVTVATTAAIPPVTTEAPPPATTVAAPVATEPPPPDPLAELLASLSVEEKVGQLFLGSYTAETGVENAQNYHLGGYIFFSEDFENETPDTVREALSACQLASKVPMLMAVDEEGGRVSRVSCFPAFRAELFPFPRILYQSQGLEGVLAAEAEKSQLLSGLGLNLNLAPVCDITTDPDSFLFDRSLGLPPEETARIITEMIRVMRESGVGSALKHFPGYGNNTDTHLGMAIDDRPLKALEDWDLIPFAAGIKAGCRAIMVSHTIVTALDSSLPATLSPAVHDYLRQEMGFEGVIITDDLTMQAISDHYGPGEAAVMAVLAGNDLLCCLDYKVPYQAVLEAVYDGRISVETLDSAVLRLLKWKSDLGLL